MTDAKITDECGLPATEVSAHSDATETTSRRMAAVRQRDTLPELTVRRLAHRLGYRFRVHQSDLPGKPDIVFSRLKTVIFVHGCFWHRHQDCKRASMPRTRKDYWTDKFAKTVSRDRDQRERLRAAGWKVYVIWECETIDRNRLRQTLESTLGLT